MTWGVRFWVWGGCLWLGWALGRCFWAREGCFWDWVWWVLGLGFWVWGHTYWVLLGFGGSACRVGAWEVGFGGWGRVLGYGGADLGLWRTGLRLGVMCLGM